MYEEYRVNRDTLYNGVSLYIVIKLKIWLIDKGLGNWKSSEYPALEKQLLECYEKGHEVLPEDSSKTPIWFGATAGMRVLK